MIEATRPSPSSNSSNGASSPEGDRVGGAASRTDAPRTDAPPEEHGAAGFDPTGARASAGASDESRPPDGTSPPNGTSNGASSNSALSNETSSNAGSSNESTERGGAPASAGNASLDLPDGGSNEDERLRTLRQYNVLDAPPAEAFDRITRLAMRLFDVPIAMINFIDRNNQWCVSARGISARQTPRNVSFCTHTVQQSEVMVVENTTQDDRFKDNPFVTGEPHIRFYAGAPLTAPNGHRIGTLCLLDEQPHSFSKEQQQSLEDLAGVVMDELNLRTVASDLDASRRHHREQHEHTSRILESITDAFFALNDEWEFTYVNAQAENFLKRSRAELLGRNVWDEFSEAVGSRFEDEYHYAVEENTTVEFVEHYPPLERWFEVKAFPFRGGLSVYFDDVTQRIEAKKDLRRERDLTEAIMDTSVAAILNVNVDGTIAFANEPAGEILGMAPEDLVGRSQFKAVESLYTLDGEPLSPDEWPFHDAFNGESISDLRLVIKRHDGKTRTLSVNAAPLYHSDRNAVRQIVFSIDDITQQIERQRELEAARDEAERASRLKSSFLANMSHDVRTPLSSIMSLTELLSMEAPEYCQERIELIERSSNRLLDTIDSVLDLSRLESGSIEPSYQPVDLVDELLGTAEIFQPQAAEKGVDLITDVEEETTIRMELDPTMLHRIADNLISNALKFTKEGDRVILRAYVEGNRAAMEVEDTGIGIEEDFLPDLFEAFARSPAGSKESGSGLGLAITKHLTEAMGGEIEVDSKEGVGTTFTVWFDKEM